MRSLMWFRKRQTSGAAAPLRRDPAPSRAQYRMQRMWLTPLYRALLRVGLPVFAGTLAVGVYLSDDARRGALVAGAEAVQTRIEARPEFQVALISVEGASDDLAAAIRAKLALTLPQSSFDIDMTAARARVETLDAVGAADLRVRTGGVLQVRITERVPVVVWRHDYGIDLLDATGHRVASLADRADRADLPLLAGEGADTATAQALEIVAAAGPIVPRMRGLIRMGARRWDIVLDRDQRILLPAAEPVRALERLLALDQAQRLLDRDILTVDLRDDRRPVLRLAPPALASLRRASGLEPPETEL